MNDLREVTREPYFLEKAGFVRRDDESGDVDRWVWYERTIVSGESEVTLVLQVEFELSISDNPFVRTTDNFSYSFNGGGEDFCYRTSRWPRRNYRLVIVRQKRCNELLDPFVVWDSEKCMKLVPIQAEARP